MVARWLYAERKTDMTAKTSHHCVVDKVMWPSKYVILIEKLNKIKKNIRLSFWQDMLSLALALALAWSYGPAIGEKHRQEALSCFFSISYTTTVPFPLKAKLVVVFFSPPLVKFRRFSTTDCNIPEYTWHIHEINGSFQGLLLLCRKTILEANVVFSNSPFSFFDSWQRRKLLYCDLCISMHSPTQGSQI